jgi:hypothetical protein
MADYIRPTPRNPILGLLADALTGGVEWMRSPQRAQQMQGLGGLLAETGIPATVERMSYGEPLTKGRGMTTRLRPEAEAALMTLAPEAVPIGRAAMAGIRATKGLPVGAATVYHGSPYRFQRFDPTKIGSGEGAQAYGYGHYVAESPAVAKEYQSALSNKSGEILLNGKKFNPSNYEVTQIVARYSDNPKELNSRLNEYVSKYAGNPYSDVELAQRAIKTLNAGGSVSPASSGSLYTIDLPDPAIARMLDWDKPLSEQTEYVRKALEPLGYKSDKAEIDAFSDALLSALQGEGSASLPKMPRNPMGSQIARGQGIFDAPQDKVIAERLRQAGIPGIRYLDQGSRSNFRVQNSVRGNPYGEPVSFMTEKQAQDYAQEQAAKGFQTQILPGTSNFVVFPGEEELLRILNVEGGLLAP